MISQSLRAFSHASRAALPVAQRRSFGALPISGPRIMATRVAKPTDVPEVLNGTATKELEVPKPEVPPAVAAVSAPEPMKEEAKAPAAKPTAKPAAKPSAAKSLAAMDEVSGPMLQPSVFNNNAVRFAAIAVTVAISVATTQFLPSRMTSFLHLTAFAVFLGTNIWNTFFVGLTLFKLLPRQTFGKIQSKLFPLYFAVTSGSAVVLLGTLLFSGNPVPGSVLATLGAGVVCSLLNWVVVEPVCEKYMFERYDIENKAQKNEADKLRIKELYGQFGKWHGISSLLNLVVLVVGFAHGWHLTGAFVA